ncbi:MAG: transketolase [Candidatus Dependentiae bacterium]|nr:transketolase [Candidatus Dependentiae bacterium]
MNKEQARREQDNEISSFLEHKAYNLRKWSIIQTSQAGSGHVTSCLSAADIIAVLFFYSMQYDAGDFNNPDNDRFVLSKGHAAPVLYAAWKEVGVLTEQDLLGYRTIGSTLEGHPTYRFQYAQAATGSLGMGLSIGVGIALCAKLDKRSCFTYVLMGDSETAEGSVWEAVSLAVYYKLDKLVGIIDCNRLGQSTETMLGCQAQKYSDIYTSFGFKTYIVDGHSIPDLMAVFDASGAALGSEQPIMVIAKTHKGYGIESVEDKEGFHGQAFKKENREAVLAQLKERFLDAAMYTEDRVSSQLLGHTASTLPDTIPAMSQKLKEYTAAIIIPSSFPYVYAKEAMIATRKAYGEALALLGDVLTEVVCLDAEVKNSTYAELFEKKHPDRFFQCFVAEQNMIGMGIGFSRWGKIPFISTFGSFFTRAHDQIRMAVLSNAALRLVGSHVGVSIGQDGPSQMALEDIGMMRALPNSIVLYPSDAVSTHSLVAQMAQYSAGVSYMRTTRSETPILYGANEEFPVGGCKVVRKSSQDKVCIIAAGITVWQALKAYDSLAMQEAPVYVAVIDLYSIKPFDRATVIATAHSAGNKIITVEDHYIQGGIGEMIAAALCDTGITVVSLAVTELPHSGKPEELLAWAHIDAQAIVTEVLSLLRR